MKRRVLIVSPFHPELRPGGSQRVAYDLFKHFRQSDEVDAYFLAAIDERQWRYAQSGAPIDSFEGRPAEYVFRAEHFDPVWQKLCSAPAMEALADFLTFCRPDVIHLHHFVFFGIDCLSIIRRTLPQVRIVLTLHDFAIICPANGCMVRTMDRSLCDSATAVRCHQCLPDREPNHFEQRKMWFRRHLSEVDVFLSPSRFVVGRHVAWGIDADRIRLVPNGIDQQRVSIQAQRDRLRNRFGFFGQLIDLKGLRLILRAVALLREEGFVDFSIEINGDNLSEASQACRGEFESFMAEELLRPHRQQIVVDNGPYVIEQIESRMSRIDWCVMPSLWWEAFGLVISEAWANGRPVICSNVGAMAERVTHERNGLLFSTGDAEALAATIRRAASEPGLWQTLSNDLPNVETVAEMAAACVSTYAEPRRSPVMCDNDDVVARLNR